MKIAFWSPTPFAGRKSTNLLLLSFLPAMEGKEQLVIHADENGSGPEHYLLSGNERKRMMKRKEFGLDLLDRMLRCERFEKSLVVNASYTFAEGCLHLLPAGESFFRQNQQQAITTLEAVCRQAEREFHTVWIEAPAGWNELSGAICRMADLVVINLAQSPWELERIEDIPEFERELFLIGAYEKQTIYSGHNISLLHPRMKNRCEVIPYRKDLLQACFYGKAEEYMKKASMSADGDERKNIYREMAGASLAIRRIREAADEK